MKLYLLQQRDGFNLPVYDSAHGFVVAAKDSTSARRLAAKRHGDESAMTWLNKKYSSAKRISSHTSLKEGIVLRDFNSG